MPPRRRVFSFHDCDEIFLGFALNDGTGRCRESTLQMERMLIESVTLQSAPGTQLQRVWRIRENLRLNCFSRENIPSQNSFPGGHNAFSGPDFLVNGCIGFF